MFSFCLHILCVLILLVLVVIFVFFCFAPTLVACNSLGARLFCFVIPVVVVSASCFMQCALVPHHLSPIRFSVFCTVIFSFFMYYRHADFS